MGFGLLFVGYLATYLLSISNYGNYPAIIGCFLMLYALSKLAEYEGGFKKAFFAALPMTAAVGALLVCDMLVAFGVLVKEDIVIFDAVAHYVKIAADIAYHVTLLFAVARIARNTELPKIEKAAWRNLLISSLFFVTEVVEFTVPTTSPARMYIFFAAVLLWLSSLTLNGVMLMSCYMRICPEGDEDLPQKPSRFGFINKFRESYDRREAKMQNELKKRREEEVRRSLDRRRERLNKKRKGK